MFRDAASLFASPLRLRVLTFFVRQEGAWASAEQVAGVLASPKQAVSRELAVLARFGMLRTRRAARTTSYSVNERAPLYLPLREFAASALTPDRKDIARAFAGVRGVTLVVVSGLLTNEPKSPIEVLVVSRRPDVKSIERAIKKIEALAALPMRYAVLEAGEYAERRQAYDRLLRDVFEYRHEVILERT